MKRLCLSILETEFESKLNHAWSGACRSDFSERRRSDQVSGIRVIYPVKDVEKFSAKLTAKSFVKRYEFDKRNINILLSRSVKEIARRVAERIIRVKGRSAQTRCSKSISIKILIQSVADTAAAFNFTTGKSGIKICALNDRSAV